MRQKQVVQFPMRRPTVPYTRAGFETIPRTLGIVFNGKQ